MQSSEQHILLLDTLVAKYKVFDKTFHAIGTLLLKQDGAAVESMTFYAFGLAPDCKKAAVNELLIKFETAIDKYQQEEESEL
jgi:hypothetical protein